MEAVRKAQSFDAGAIARKFVTARLKGTFVPGFPGDLPDDLAQAYAVQDAAIAMWPDDVAGWKIGKIPPEHAEQLGAISLAGPVFRKDVHLAAPGATVEYGIYIGGFAAVEAEYMFEIGQDAPVSKTSWSTADAVSIVKRMLCGVETAGSPLASINVIGPRAVVSDFGNNNGLIVGPEVPDWRNAEMTELLCETFIDGKSVGHGSAANVAGGPIASLRFVAELLAKRGRPLKAGMLITTGAITGIHDVVPGQLARVEFKGLGAVQCTAKPLAARS
jgi:2-keto-4-pentenoate hydratase